MLTLNGIRIWKKKAKTAAVISWTYREGVPFPLYGSRAGKLFELVWFLLHVCLVLMLTDFHLLCLCICECVCGKHVFTSDCLFSYFWFIFSCCLNIEVLFWDKKEGLCLWFSLRKSRRLRTGCFIQTLLFFSLPLSPLALAQLWWSVFVGSTRTLSQGGDANNIKSETGALLRKIWPEWRILLRSRGRVGVE